MESLLLILVLKSRHAVVMEALLLALLASESHFLFSEKLCKPNKLKSGNTQNQICVPESSEVYFCY